MKAIILAAGLGTRLEPLTRTVPKCMVPVAGVPLIDRMIARIEEAGIDSLVVVTGHLHQVLEAHLRASPSPLAQEATLVFNQRYADWGNFYSLLVAREAVGTSGFIKLDGDVLLDSGILPAVVAAPGPAVLAIDRKPGLGAEEMKARADETGRLVALNKRMAPALALGEYIGVDRIDAPLAPRVFDELAAMIDQGEVHEYYERAYERLMQAGVAFSCADVTSAPWCEIDDHADLAAAHALVARQTR